MVGVCIEHELRSARVGRPERVSGPSEAAGDEAPRSERAGPGQPADVRFSYANERTFLAWLRTALGLVTAGLAIAELLPPFGFTAARRLIGLTLIALGGLVALSSLRVWQRNERAMCRGDAPPRSSLPLVVAVVVSIVSLLGLAASLAAGLGR